jgi:hypothetical protein
VVRATPGAHTQQAPRSSLPLLTTGRRREALKRHLLRHMTPRPRLGTCVGTTKQPPAAWRHLEQEQQPGWSGARASALRCKRKLQPVPRVPQPPLLVVWYREQPGCTPPLQAATHEHTPQCKASSLPQNCQMAAHSQTLANMGTCTCWVQGWAPCTSGPAADSCPIY